jgi:Flp pilus assembly protein TadG
MRAERKRRVRQGGKQLGIFSDSLEGRVEAYSTLASNLSRRDSDRRIGRLSSFRSRAVSARGQSSVEFALALPVFFILICGVMDFGRMFFVQENVQQAVEAAARYASTGIHQSGTNPATNKSYTRVDSIDSYIAQQASVPINMGATLSSIAISSVQGGSGSAGGPQDIETITVTTTVPLMTPIISHFFPNGIYSFTASASIKNEPFSPTQTN